MRQPVYTKDHTHRIISMPNGLWACQANHGGEGAMRLSNQPHYDPWSNTHRPISKDEALRQLSTFGQIDL